MGVGSFLDLCYGSVLLTLNPPFPELIEKLDEAEVLLRSRFDEQHPVYIFPADQPQSLVEDPDGRPLILPVDLTADVQIPNFPTGKIPDLIWEKFNENSFTTFIICTQPIQTFRSDLKSRDQYRVEDILEASFRYATQKAKLNLTEQQQLWSLLTGGNVITGRWLSLLLN